ncbi:MAG: hypothetical protein ACRENT_09270, partial [Thermodesulfobacteriota bacterium]
QATGILGQKYRRNRRTFKTIGKSDAVIMRIRLWVDLSTIVSGVRSWVLGIRAKRETQAEYLLSVLRFVAKYKLRNVANKQRN